MTTTENHEALIRLKLLQRDFRIAITQSTGRT
jgi:hypothetical protein